MKLLIFFSVALILSVHSYNEALAQQSGMKGCPFISVSHPEATSTGSTLTYKASILGGDSSVTPTFNWTVSAGKITGGQGTSEVSVEAESDKSITVTVEVIGYRVNCPNKASNSRLVEPMMSRKFDEYRGLKFNEERLRLDQFAIELHKTPGSKGYIIIYNGKDTRNTDARVRGERAKNYLVKERGLPEAQIVIVNGPDREKWSVELFITPAGALPPIATRK